LIAMSRPLVVAGLVLALALAACGGSDTTTVTSQPPNETALHWSRCAQSSAMAGMSCHAADRFVRDAVSRVPTPGNGTRPSILKSNPRSFNIGAFDCTEFPLESGFGWHVLCKQADQQVSFFITP
jgi:hypothetical protein